ncbi:MAG: probable sulfite oxidase [uncultured Nocardioidaceae bacterium]|uniref:Probable sulfite oxidase n=1 Tax=uncultured Nocardioidaceae bacterium TaxID=253824 RepID=A0A6J4LT83_9ACTN|nr:MAG: probable sulfite oxidase [uncultured Nocardioidaceae bacterium]
MDRRWAAFAGVVTAVVGLGVAELLSALLRVRVSPVLAVGEGIIEITPGALAERAIAAVGRADKPLLVTGVVLGVLAVSALAGVLAARHRSAGLLLLAAQAGLAAFAAMARPASSPYDLLPALVAGAVSIAVLELLLRRAPLPKPHSDPAGGPDDDPRAVGGVMAVPDAGRRRFLRTAAGAVGVAGVLAVAGRWAASARSGVERARRELDLRLRAAGVPAGVQVDVPDMPAWHTPTNTFYRIDTALAVPLVDPGDWQLRIHGMVDRELVLTYDDLLARGLDDAWVTLCCVSNPVGGELVGNTRWSGVRIDELLAEVGVSADADALLSTSEDGWTCGTPLAELTDGRDALLAVAMDGEPLPLEHGFPVRMVVPGLYGFVSATKWVVDWEVSRFDRFSAYWTDRGWSARGPVKTSSRIDVPRGGTSVAAGPVAVAGVAFAQHRGIERVEIRIDDGAWEPARLADVPSTDTWVQWVYDWEATPGEHLLTVRATDATGELQSGADVDVVPDGAEGWHDITVQVS